MKKFIIVSLFACWFAVSYCEAATIYVSSYGDGTASKANVDSAIADASDGDTVIVPAGTAEWTGRVLFGGKAITFQGAGVGTTIIKPSAGFADDQLLYALLNSGDPLTRITGITFDGDGKAIGGIKTSWEDADDPNTPPFIRIDNNQFLDFLGADGAINVGSAIDRNAYGVIDSNEFIDNKKAGVEFEAGGSCDGWDLPAAHTIGTQFCMYVEDNVFRFTGNPAFAPLNLSSSGLGSRGCYRYNVIDWRGVAQTFQMFDAHGNQADQSGGEDCSSRGTVFLEIYRNTIYEDWATGQQFLDPRGGTFMVWDNIQTNTAAAAGMRTGMREEDGDERFDWLQVWPGSDPVRDSYFWGNTRNGAQIDATVKAGVDNEVFIQHNLDFWNQIGGFDGTSGIGVGQISSRPLTCTTVSNATTDNNGVDYDEIGVGYWATNVGTWNKKPGETQGIFYRCTDTNTWTEYYVPYEYPHPLRGVKYPNVTIDINGPNSISIGEGPNTISINSN